jgi:hypothetical protein
VRRVNTDTMRPSHDQIAQLAYRRFEARGRVDGHDLDDWLMAERELRQAPLDLGGMLFGLYERRTY